MYSFSNGGAFVVEQLKLIAESSDPRHAGLREAVVGFIFDSAPGYMHPHMGPKVLAADTPPGIWRFLRTSALVALTTLTPLFQGDRPVNYWREMTELDWGRPFLFLYSADDPLCDAAKLQGLIETKRAWGQRVTAVRWEASEHCGHLVRHRGEYEAALVGFLRELGGAGPRPRL